MYTDEEFKILRDTYKHLPPVSKESLYFREIFSKICGKNADHILSHYWMPAWCPGVMDPSARELDVCIN